MSLAPTTTLHNIRLEVMQTLEKNIGDFVKKYLLPIEKCWQPTDFLPDSTADNFVSEVVKMQEEAKELSYDFWVVLIGDMVTEEALPTYESWLLDVDGIDQHQKNGWGDWIRTWTAEENRHGDVLNKYLYLSGRVNMKEIEKTIQYLIKDGMAIGTDRDPYKNFVYTSFQELATNISHKRVSALAYEQGNKMLGKMCQIIAGDEMRHHLAYREFVKKIIEYDPSEMILAFASMMKKTIAMPAMYLRESGESIGSAFEQFSMAAQRLGVYTSQDYVDILNSLNKHWDIGNITDLTSEAEKARDYLMKLPDRMLRVAERLVIPDTPLKFKWVEANGM